MDEVFRTQGVFAAVIGALLLLLGVAVGWDVVVWGCRGCGG